MSVRREILELNRSGRLRWGSVPLPPRDVEELRRSMPDVISAVANPEIFEFDWQDAAISLDDGYDTHYPTVDDWEWLEGIASPVPHPFIWLQTRVLDPHGDGDRFYIWNIERKGMCGYSATPLVYHQGILSYFGTYFELDPSGVDPDGRRGRVTVFNSLESYDREYEIEEFFRQSATLARFFRLLNLPGAEIEIWEPEEKLNRARIRKGKEPLAIRKTVRIDSAALLRRRNGAGSKHASPAEHFRRAHPRRLPNGRTTNVRNCIVNPGRGPEDPTPQDFTVR